jgi:hypothetical protein
VRYAARIVAKLTRRNEVIELLTNDVSFRGAFLRSDAPPLLRQLLRVSFALPSGKKISAHAMVVRIIAVGNSEGAVPGFGLQFWGALDDAKSWEQFVYDLKVKERAGAASARITDKVRRSSERFRLAIAVALDGKKAVTRDVSLTGIAVRTALPMPIGTQARLSLSAPSAETIALDVVVRRKIEEPDFKGLGLEFVDVSPEARATLLEFVKAHAPGDDAELVDPDDPRLQ